MSKRIVVRHLIETILLRLGPMPPRRVRRQLRASFNAEVSESSIRNILPRMVTAGLLIKLDRGRYCHPSWPGLKQEERRIQERNSVPLGVAAWQRMDWDAVVQKIERQDKQIADNVATISSMRAVVVETERRLSSVEKELGVLNEAVEQLLSGSIDRQDLDNARNQADLDPFS